MSLSSTSNTINALGIFGRLDPIQEKYFQEISDEYSQFPKGDDSVGIFNHLSLVINNSVPIGKVSDYLDLLKKLKQYLPLKIKTSDVIVIDDKHVALSFDISQTQVIRDLASRFFSEGIINTNYTKVVWSVSKENQAKVIEKLKEIKEMIFYDFKLVANRQDEANTLYSSNSF